MLGEEFLKYNFTSTICDASDRERMRHVLPLAYSALATAVDRHPFEADGMCYLCQNREEISTDVGFILVQATKKTSKWMKHDVR